MPAASGRAKGLRDAYNPLAGSRFPGGPGLKLDASTPGGGRPSPPRGGARVLLALLAGLGAGVPEARTASVIATLAAQRRYAQTGFKSELLLGDPAMGMR